MTDKIDTVEGQESEYFDELCQALKSNTTLTELDLWSEYKRKKDTFHMFMIQSLLFTQVTTLETQE